MLPLPQQCRLVHCLKPQRVQTGSGKCHHSSTFLPPPNGKHNLSPAEGVWSAQVPSACGVQEQNSSLIQQHGKTVKSSEVSPNSDCIRLHGARSRLFFFLGGGGSLYNAMQFTLRRLPYWVRLALTALHFDNELKWPLELKVEGRGSLWDIQR